MKYIHKQSVISIGILILLAFAVTAFAQANEENTATPEVIEEEGIVPRGEESVAGEGAVEETQVPIIEVNVPEENVETVESTEVEESTEVVAETVLPVAEEEVAPIPVVNIKGVRDIAMLQDSYFEKTGNYLQILPGNELPAHEEGSVTQKLGGTLPADAYVHVYESPKGKGYQIFFKDGNTLISTGFGPEAADRTYTKELAPALSATSTEAI